MGCGNVGRCPGRDVRRPAQEDVAARTGIRLELVGIAVADTTSPARPAFARELFGDGRGALVVRNDVDVVVELIGGTHPAHELIEAALRAGKPVVTGNKALLAVAGAELAEVGGLCKGSTSCTRRRWPARSRLCGRYVSRWPASRSCGSWASSNGTTNYILTRMEDDGVDFEDALAEAQSARAGRARSHRRRRGPRRRGQGGHPGRPGLRESTWWTPTCTARGSPGYGRPTSRTPSGSATRSSCWPWPNWCDGGPELSVTGAPGDGARRRTPWRRCAAPSTPCSSRER